MKMIPKNKKKVLMHVLRSAEMNNVNQISRKLGISVGSAFKILKEFEKKEIVSVLEMGNAMYYSINFKNMQAAKLCELLLLEEKNSLKSYARLYSEELDKFGEAELIMLFGSVLKGQGFNDVDVLFVESKPKKVMQFCLDLSKVKSRPVVPLIIKKSELIKEIRSKKQALLDIIKKGVVIKGESVFLEVIRDAESKA